MHRHMVLAGRFLFAAASFVARTQNGSGSGQPTSGGGWTVGSWPITEPSTGYQAKYVLVLAAVAHSRT